MGNVYVAPIRNAQFRLNKGEKAYTFRVYSGRGSKHFRGSIKLRRSMERPKQTQLAGQDGAEDSGDRWFPELDRRSLTVTNLGDNSDDVDYWRNRTPQERIRAVEMLRRLNYGIDATSSRLQRLLEIDERAWS